MNIKNLSLVIMLVAGSLGLASDPGSTPDEWTAIFLASSTKTKKLGKKKKSKSAIAPQTVVTPKLTPEEREKLEYRLGWRNKTFTDLRTKESGTGLSAAVIARELELIYKTDFSDAAAATKALKELDRESFRRSKEHGVNKCSTFMCQDLENKTFCRLHKEFYCKAHFNEEEHFNCIARK